jgi:hypothetical protein
MTTDYQAIKNQMAEILHNASVTAEVGAPHFSTDYPFISNGKAREAWPHFSYVLFFRGPRGGFSTDYHCGADDAEQGKKAEYMQWTYPRPNKTRIPAPAEVLGMLCRDALDAREESLESWASNFGYDTDSRSAEAIYRKCVDMWHDLRKLLNESDIRELADLAQQL